MRAFEYYMYGNSRIFLPVFAALATAGPNLTENNTHRGLNYTEHM